MNPFTGHESRTEKTWFQGKSYGIAQQPKLNFLYPQKVFQFITFTNLRHSVRQHDVQSSNKGRVYTAAVTPGL